MKTVMLLPLIAAFLLSACSKSGTQVDAPVLTPSAAVPVTVNKTLLLQLVNETRSKGCKCGNVVYSAAPPLTWNDQLEAAALKHSNDMYKGSFFSHIGTDGTNGGMRIDRAGYKWVAYGENIAAGYTSERAAIEGWIQSPGHCKNLMDKAYKEMGVARVGNYWTQDFAAR